MRLFGLCAVEFHLPNLHVPPRALPTKPMWPSTHLSHQTGKHPQHGASLNIHLQLQFPAPFPFVTPGNFLDLCPQRSIYKSISYIYTSISRYMYLGSFHFVVVCSGGGISRDSNLVNSMVCLGSRTWDIRFCWRSSRRSSMSQGSTAGAAAAQYLE